MKASAQNVIIRYGRIWDGNLTDLDIELAAFKLELTVEENGLGKYWHCRNIIDMLWNREDSPMRFDWHPWAERMVEEACENTFLSVAGCGSSGKSDTFAVYAIVCYLADPRNTRVLVTSTSLKDSRMRIWGRIKEYWGAVPGLPGKLVDSMGMIKFVDEKGEADEGSGIVLVAGESKKEKESIKKLIGFKRARVIMIADEMPELSSTIYDAALSNLDLNPYFQLIGIGNPNSRFDAFGVFSKPKAGWGSVSTDADEWETTVGKCIRFDAEKSPNILAGQVLYPYLITEEKLAKKKSELGENSLLYWRMYRGFWCPTGSDAGLYSEADITQSGADSSEVHWMGHTTRVAFLDTSFTSGGDEAVAYLGTYGVDIYGTDVLLLDPEPHVLADDVSVNDSFNFQIAKKFRDLCHQHHVSVKHAGLDVTGGGTPFADILASVWGEGFHRCLFSGSATERTASASDTRPCSDVFTNKVSELWGIGVQFVRTGQFRGVTKDLAQEMTARLYSIEGKGKISVEPKRKMKARFGRSPDRADAAFGLLDLCRERLSFECEEIRTVRPPDEGSGSGGGGSMTWDEYVSQSHAVYAGYEGDESDSTIPLHFF